MMLGMQQSLPQMGHVVAQQSAPFTLPPLNTTPSNNSPQPPSQSCAPAVGGPLQVPLVKQRCMRPKLALNTDMNLSHTRSFGKGSTSLRLDTLSAVSPTIRNTFSNAYVQPKSASLPGSRSATPVDAKQKPVLLRLEVPKSSNSLNNAPSMLTPTSQPETIPEEDSTSGSLSSISSSTVSPESGVIPYILPTHHRSILTNSLLPKTDSMMRIKRMSKPMFALPKTVTFKDPLQEEIQTTKYIFSHYSLVQNIKEEEEKEQKNEKLEIPTLSIETVSSAETSQSADAPKLSEQAPSPTRLRLAEFKFPPPASLKDLISAGVTPPASEELLSPVLFSSPQTMSASSSPVSSPVVLLEEESGSTVTLPNLSSLPHRPVHHQRHLKRDSSSSESSDDNESNSSCAHTPVAGRSKKRRMWVWTLGPLDGYDGPVEASAFGDELNVKTVAEESTPKPLTIVTTDLAVVTDINIETSPEVTIKTSELFELDIAAQTPLPMDDIMDHDFIMVERDMEINEVNEMPTI